MPPKGGIRSAAYAAFIKAMAKPSRPDPALRRGGDEKLTKIAAQVNFK
jgi:hypothetical protein